MVVFFCANILPQRIDVEVCLRLQDEELLLVGLVLQLRSDELCEGFLVLHVD